MEELESFFKLIFGKTRGYLSLAFIHHSNRKDFKEKYYRYPEQLEQACEAITKYSQDYNAYFCPQLFKSGTLGSRKKENVIFAPMAYADLDGCHPDNLLVEPSVVIESSPDRFQALWLLDESQASPKFAEDLSRRIAYLHKDQGCDQSGWDLTQLLRVPYTVNYKYKIPKPVKLVSVKNETFSADEFKEYPHVKSYGRSDEPMPDISNINVEQLLDKNKADINPRVFELFENIPPQTDWSTHLWNLELALFEGGFDKPQVFAVARKAACNKYDRDQRGDKPLWKEVLRAYDDFMAHKENPVQNPYEITELLTDKERELVKQLPTTFVERYIKWASAQTDAAVQYHQAGAFTILSSLLCGTVVLPTSYGRVVPNLWFMILADTTITRKSTSMDLAIDLISELDEDIVMATDTTVEGMMGVLSQRPARPSVFLKDEFSGLLDSMVRKDYMAGMPEMLTKLYDAKNLKRVLKKEVIDVKRPRLILYAGGIKNKVCSLITYEHVSSGFMPRFIFITAETDLNKVRPMGPATLEGTTKEREALSAEMTLMQDHYQAQSMITINGDIKIENSKEFITQLTSDAWARYNMLENDLMVMALKSDMPDIYTPVGVRLANSILKAAVLIAASRQRSQGVVVELHDMLLAIKYGEHWREYAYEVVSNIGRSGYETMLMSVYSMVKEKGFMKRSELMRMFKLQSRVATEMFQTMCERGMLSKEGSGGQIGYVAK